MTNLENYDNLSEVSKKELFDFIHSQFLPENKGQENLLNLLSFVQRSPYISPFKEGREKVQESFDSDKPYFSYNPDTSTLGSSSNPSKAKMSFEKFIRFMPGLANPESDLSKISFIESHLSNINLFNEVNINVEEQF